MTFETENSFYLNSSEYQLPKYVDVQILEFKQDANIVTLSINGIIKSFPVCQSKLSFNEANTRQCFKATIMDKTFSSKESIELQEEVLIKLYFTQERNTKKLEIRKLEASYLSNDNHHDELLILWENRHQEQSPGTGNYSWDQHSVPT